MKPAGSGLLALAIFVLTGCPAVESPGDKKGQKTASITAVKTPTTRLSGGGSSFIYPLMVKWASEYEKERGIKVDYSSTGSGNGIQQMTRKTIDFGCTDAPMTDPQLAQAMQTGGEVVHLPLIMGAVVPAYNLPGVSKPIQFTGPVIADIYLGKIKKWNDPALQDLNKDATLPDQDIAVVHRSDGSGSTFIWADYLAKVSPEWKEKVGVNTTLKWPCGVGQKGTEGVAAQISRSPGALGYVELIYALKNNIQYGAVKNRAGKFVLPSLESVTAAAQGALATIPADLRYSLTDAEGEDAYPLAGTTWMVFYQKQPADKAAELVNFVRWATHEGQRYAKELQYAGLPTELVQRIEQKLELIKGLQ
jgi:phosphate transport system substrate-binding protein